MCFPFNGAVAVVIDCGSIDVVLHWTLPNFLSFVRKKLKLKARSLHVGVETEREWLFCLTGPNSITAVHPEYTSKGSHWDCEWLPHLGAATGLTITCMQLTGYRFNLSPLYVLSDKSTSFLPSF